MRLNQQGRLRPSSESWQQLHVITSLRLREMKGKGKKGKKGEKEEKGDK